MTTSLADSPVVTSSTLRTGQFALASEVLPSMWIIDSGASHHMHNGKDFTTYERLPNPIRIQLESPNRCVAQHHPFVILYCRLRNWILMDIIQSLVTASVPFEILEIR